MRKGECKKCGCCGDILIPCEHYDPKTKLCKIWDDIVAGKNHYLCKIYPFDEKDKTAYSKLNCGFYWEK